ncbi:MULTISPECIES: hypothetical protein [unclassified Streptomyces]|uniref:hypothetical protein n=1 Tax=unclassified Streptomyces TaxID=2593676 RepID=UPI000B82F1E8|nr:MULTISPECIES: hypothetical protein [unclassified Streptomyces]
MGQVHLPRHNQAADRFAESAMGIPGLDLPELNIAATAASYGIDAHEANDTDQFAEMLRAGVADRERPTLVNVRTNKVKKVAPRLT